MKITLKELKNVIKKIVITEIDRLDITGDGGIDNLNADALEIFKGNLSTVNGFKEICKKYNNIEFELDSNNERTNELFYVGTIKLPGEYIVNIDVSIQNEISMNRRGSRRDFYDYRGYTGDTEESVYTLGDILQRSDYEIYFECELFSIGYKKVNNGPVTKVI